MGPPGLLQFPPHLHLHPLLHFYLQFLLLSHLALLSLLPLAPLAHILYQQELVKLVLWINFSCLSATTSATFVLWSLVMVKEAEQLME